MVPRREGREKMGHGNILKDKGWQVIEPWGLRMTFRSMVEKMSL